MLHHEFNETLQNSQDILDKAFDAFGREKQESMLDTLREEEEKTNHMNMPLSDWHFKCVKNLRKSRDLSTFVHSYIRPRTAPSPKRNHFSVGFSNDTSLMRKSKQSDPS